MTSLRQIEANRRNARLSTGPSSEEGKKKSRQNAVRHGLTAETIINALEDADDYAAFELAVTADFEAQTAVQRECQSASKFDPISASNFGSDAYLMTASGIMRHRAIVLREGRFLRDHTFVV